MEEDGLEKVPNREISREDTRFPGLFEIQGNKLVVFLRKELDRSRFPDLPGAPQDKRLAVRGLPPILKIGKNGPSEHEFFPRYEYRL